MSLKPVDMEKTCSKCGQTKPVGEFRPQRKQCEACRKEYDRKRRQTPERKEYDRKRRQTPKRKEYLIKYYRTPERKECERNRGKTPKRKEYDRKRRQTPKRKEYLRIYYIQNNPLTQDFRARFHRLIQVQNYFVKGGSTTENK